MPERITAPCRDCPDRKLHCHSSCERYKQYKDTLEDYKAKKATENAEKAFYADIKGAVKRLRDHKRGSDRRRRR